MRLRRKQLCFIALVLLACIATTAGCGGRQASPEATLRAFYEAALKRDAEGMKRTLSKSSVSYFERMARGAGKTLDEGLRANAEAIKQKMPETRGEKIEGDAATIEVKHSGSDRWEVIAFVKEEGAWKLALDQSLGQNRMGE